MTVKHLFPQEKPVLNLDFANVKRLDRRITFTRASTATYVGSDKLIKTAADNEARFDFDPVTGDSLGLLIEESRTNLFTHSDSLISGWVIDGTYWNRVANAAIAPDGTNTATKLIPKAGITNQTTNQSIGVTSGTTYTGTVFVKAGEMTKCRLSFFAQGATPAVYVDMAAGTISTGGVCTGTISKLPNGWYRVSMTWNETRSNATKSGIGYDSLNKPPANGSDGFYVWGAQLEVGAFPTSYIPTTTAAVTRAADVASLTNSGIYNTDVFTILSEPFGSAAGASTLSLVGAGGAPIERTAVYNQALTATEINAIVGKTDEFWRWRILGSSFGLPHFATDGQVTVDWGDGTVATLTTSDHAFIDGGKYHDIGFRLDSGTYFQPEINLNATHKDKVVAVGPAPESMRLSAIRAFNGCNNLKAFDATVDAEGLFTAAWRSCAGLTSFPLIGASGASTFVETWYACTSLTSFPAIDTSSGTNFSSAWRNCRSLTSFPALDFSSGTTFYQAWRDCSSLTDFPPGVFNSWAGTPVTNCFRSAWDGCTSLTATSVENILNSIDTSGQSAPASGVDITIDYDAGTGTPSIATAVTNLKARGWTIHLNGAAQ